jgi:putative NIF3 family GTP cyclohydrolase 1 type 2
MLAKDILEHFLSNSPWVDLEKTVDRVIVGDSDVDVDTCVVCWIPSTANLKKAAEMGAKLFVTHEPTFWDHWDDKPGNTPASADKLAMINHMGMTIVRLHDTWDKWDHVGIPFAWAKHLGLYGDGSTVTRDDSGYLLRCDVEPMTLGQLAARVAAACKPFGEGIVQVTGDPDMIVSKVGCGTGCGCDLDGYYGLGCDAGIVCDDGSCYWAGIQNAEDIGFGVIRVNHGTSEEAGMITLADYITSALGVAATYLPTGCVFQLIDAEGQLR